MRRRAAASKVSSRSSTRARAAACSSSSSSVVSMSSVKPRIALTTPRATATDATYARYARALERAGATVVELTPGDTLPDDVDGVCFSGGGDVDPSRYAAQDDGVERKTVSKERDDLELDV